MSAPPPSESSFATLLRRMFRAYRNNIAPVGHAVMRRAFQAMLARHQVVTLRNGIRLQVDLERVVQHSLFWLDGDMEPRLEWAVRELMPIGGTCVDCGANCGYIGLLARRMRSARVIFIEPHPELAATVRRNIELNGWQEDCTVVEAAASDGEGTAEFYENQSYDGAHSLLADWAGGQSELRTIRVRLNTLPAILASERVDRVDLLKVDTEGHDLSVLKGIGAGLVPGRFRVVYTELGRDKERGCDLMQAAGYEGFSYAAVSGGNLRRLVRRHEHGMAVVFFEPMDALKTPPADILWVPRGGNEARHLRNIRRLAGADGPR